MDHPKSPALGDWVSVRERQKKVELLILRVFNLRCPIGKAAANLCRYSKSYASTIIRDFKVAPIRGFSFFQSPISSMKNKKKIISLTVKLHDLTRLCYNLRIPTRSNS